MSVKEALETFKGIQEGKININDKKHEDSIKNFMYVYYFYGLINALEDDPIYINILIPDFTPPVILNFILKNKNFIDGVYSRDIFPYEKAKRFVFESWIYSNVYDYIESPFNQINVDFMYTKGTPTIPSINFINVLKYMTRQKIELIEDSIKWCQKKKFPIKRGISIPVKYFGIKNNKYKIYYNVFNITDGMFPEFQTDILDFNSINGMMYKECLKYDIFGYALYNDV